MPIWDFKCRDCGFVFDALVKEAEKPECPECRGDTVRQASAPETTFKFADRKAIKTRK